MDSSLSGRVAHSLATVYIQDSAKHKDTAYPRNNCISMWLTASARQVTCNSVCYYCHSQRRKCSLLSFQAEAQEVLWLCLPLQVLRLRHCGTSVTHTEFQMNFCPVHHCSVPWSYGSPKCSFWLTLLWLLLTPVQTLKGSSRLPCAAEPRDESFGNNSQAELQVLFTLQQRKTTLTSAAALVKKQRVAECLTWGWSYHHEGCRKVSNVGCGSNLVSAGTSSPQPVAAGGTGSILTPKQYLFIFSSQGIKGALSC